MSRTRIMMTLLGAMLLAMLAFTPAASAEAVAIDRCMTTDASGAAIYRCGGTSLRTRDFVASTYKGWAYIFGRADCPVGAYCFAAGEPTIAAWSWTGTAWKRATLNRDEKVYAWPYSGTWHWAWTQRTGWLAVPTKRIYTWTYPVWYS